MVSAQQNRYKWRLGVETGVMNYFGDLNSELFPANAALVDKDWDFLSYSASLERNFGKASALRLTVGNGQFISSDRKVGFSGDFENETEFFGRALNVRTEIKDATLSYIYYLDNGKILSEKSFLSPFFGLGFGFTQFKTFGDLLDSDGDRYYYWSDNSVRDAPEGTVGASIIEQDGNFETPLYQLQTEEIDYAREVWHACATLGFKFRLGARMNLNLSYTAKFADTDYLDDVSKSDFQGFANSFREYANNPADFDGRRGNSSDNDIYSFTSIGLHYSFGRKKQAFKTPEIYTFMPEETSSKTGGNFSASNKKEEKQVEKVKPEGTTKLGINLKKPDSERTTSLGIFVPKDSDFKPTEEERIFPETWGEYIYTNQTGYVFFDSTGNFAQGNQKKKSTKLQIATADDEEADSVKNLIDSWVEKEKKKSTKLNIVTNEPLPDSIVNRVEANEIANEEKKKQVYNNAKTANADSTALAKNLNSTESNTKKTTETASFSVVPIVADSTNQNLKAEETLVETEVENEVFSTTPTEKNTVVVSNISTGTEIDSLTSMDSLASDSAAIALDSVANVAPNTEMEKDLAVLKAQMELLILMQKKDESVKSELAGINQKLDNMNGNGGTNNSETAKLKAELAEMRNRLSQLESGKTNVVAVNNPETNSALEELALYKNTTVFFPINVSTLSNSDKTELKKLTAYLGRVDYKVAVRGFTDKLGNAIYNKQLAMKRAEAVKSFLVKSGISESRITIDRATPDLTVGGDSSYGRRVEVEIGEVK